MDNKIQFPDSYICCIKILFEDLKINASDDEIITLLTQPSSVIGNLTHNDIMVILPFNSNCNYNLLKPMIAMLLLRENLNKSNYVPSIRFASIINNLVGNDGTFKTVKKLSVQFTKLITLCNKVLSRASLKD